MEKRNVAVKMPKKSFIKEHEHLLKVLKSGKGRKKEYQDQKYELNKVK